MHHNSINLKTYLTKISRVTLLSVIFILLAGIPCSAFALSTVNLTLDDGELDEANLDTGKFSVTRTGDGDISTELEVRFRLTGSATLSNDFTAVWGYLGASGWSLTIPANMSSISSTITPVKDNLIEGVETIVLTLEPYHDSYTLGLETVANMEISDDVVEVTLTLDDGEMDEKTLGTGQFTVTRSSNGKLDEALLIRIGFTGSATNGSDYETTNQTYVNANTRSITFPADVLTVSSIVTPIKDFDIEGDETITWTLQPYNSTYAVGTNNTAQMIIEDLIDLVFKDSYEQTDQ